MANEVKERRWLATIFVLYFVLGVGYSLLMPVWEAPDEPAHYHLAWHIAMKNRLPTEQHNYEVVQPHAYYYFASFVIRGLERLDPEFTKYFVPKEYNENIRVAERRFGWGDGNYRFMLSVHVLRWINIVVGALALWVIWRTFALIVPGIPTLRLAALGCAALTPQFLHIMSSVSNDALGTLGGAFLFYLAIRVVKEESNLLAMLAVLAAILSPLVTKLTVLPISAALIAIVAGNWFFGLRQQRWLVIASIVVLFSVGILYVFFPEALQWTQNEITWRLFSFREKGLPPAYLKRVSVQILQTYWGKVGWIAVGLPNWIIYGLTVFGLTGIVLQVRTLVSEKAAHPVFRAWIATLLIASFTILAVARNGLTTGATQGRFLFPAIGALCLLMIAGWHDVRPERVRQQMPFTIVSLMVVLNIGLWIYGVIPVYYQPFLD